MNLVLFGDFYRKRTVYLGRPAGHKSEHSGGTLWQPCALSGICDCLGERTSRRALGVDQVLNGDLSFATRRRSVQ